MRRLLTVLFLTFLAAGGTASAATAAPLVVIYQDDYTTIVTEDRGNRTFVTVTTTGYPGIEANVYAELTLSDGSTFTVYNGDTRRLPRDTQVTGVVVSYPSGSGCAGENCVTIVYSYDPVTGGQCDVEMNNATDVTFTVVLSRSDEVLGEYVVSPGEVLQVTLAGACPDYIAWYFMPETSVAPIRAAVAGCAARPVPVRASS